jgi:transcriptional regulator of acetoin/glycerol metabolism
MVNIAAAAMKCMIQYDWPGNVRELENAIERAVALGSQETLELHDLPPALVDGQEPQLALETVPYPVKSVAANTDLEQIERVTIQRVFEQVKGDKALAGKMLGISRATLYRKLKRYNIGLVNEASA